MNYHTTQPAAGQLRPDDKNYSVYTTDQAELAAMRFLRDELFYGERTFAYLEERADRVGISGPALRDAADRLGVERTIRDGGEYWFLQGPLNARNPLTEGLAALLDVAPAEDAAPKADRVGGIDPWTIPLPGDRVDFDAIRARIGSFKSIVEQEWGVQLKNGRCACQFHDGDRPDSFSVNGHKAHCFSCDWSGDVFDFVAKSRGITTADAARALDHLSGSNGKPGPNPGPTTKEKSKSRAKSKAYRTAEDALMGYKGIGALTSVWIYPDASGAALIAVGRFEPGDGTKTCRPAYVDPDGWHQGNLDEGRPLYNLPDVIKADLVIVCEGEKCVEIWKSLGFTATTSSHGAKSPHKTDWSPLAGKTVVLSPDNDPEGEGYLNSVGAILGKIKVIRLPGLIDEGDDVEQYSVFRESWSIDQIKSEINRLIDDAKIWTKSPRELPTDEEVGLTRLSDVVCVELEWLWPGRIPLGKITLIAGDGGVGKSFLTLAIASVVSRGSTWPDDPTTPVKSGHVILLSAEDDLDDTVVPRLKMMGANLSRIDALGTAKGKDGKPSPFTLQDLNKLEMVMKIRPDTRAIFIDPVTAFLGRGIDDHKNAELRGLLGPLKDFASEHKVAVICVTHFNKNASGKASARVIGSVAYSNAARATWCVAFDPEDETENRRLLMPIKANLGKSKDRTSLAYTITEKDGVVWEQEPIRVNTEEVICGPSKRTASKAERRTRAIAWLKKELEGGPIESDEIKARARSAGFGRDLIWEVKDEAGVRAKKDGQTGPWFWIIDPTNNTKQNYDDRSEPSGDY